MVKSNYDNGSWDTIKLWIIWIVVGGVILLFSSLGNKSESGDSSSYQSGEAPSDCTSDCSGHNAGYDYGKQYNICDSGYSSGKSESFNEGVNKWTKDNC